MSTLCKACQAVEAGGVVACDSCALAHPVFQYPYYFEMCEVAGSGWELTVGLDYSHHWSVGVEQWGWALNCYPINQQLTPDIMRELANILEWLTDAIPHTDETCK